MWGNNSGPLDVLNGSIRDRSTTGPVRWVKSRDPEKTDTNVLPRGRGLSGRRTGSVGEVSSTRPVNLVFRSGNDIDDNTSRMRRSL